MPRPHPTLLPRGTVIVLLAGLAALCGVAGYLAVGGDLLRGALAYAGAILTAASLEQTGVGPLRRWALALPVGGALYVLMLSLR
ncbi:hypothetical protein CVO96_10540 [Deinococcus koreensis]|uniref:Uncharacterized protein n=1 Tax=Deinococcus koreensis TaxID=2054903 RepID=A0A2K3UZ11_9DEIO|nr:hypothetical protein CVO96_10540 [Deinococcus koreensis]